MKLFVRRCIMLRKTAKASIKNEVENVKPEAIRWLAQVFYNYLAYPQCSVYTEFGNHVIAYAMSSEQ